MKVYIVFKSSDWHGDEYIATFSTYEKAEEFAAKRVRYYILEAEVE